MGPGERESTASPGRWPGGSLHEISPQIVSRGYKVYFDVSQTSVLNRKSVAANSSESRRPYRVEPASQRHVRAEWPLKNAYAN